MSDSWQSIVAASLNWEQAHVTLDGALDSLAAEQRGAHYRQDYRDPDPLWLKNILLDPRGASTQPVAFTRLCPPEMTDAKRV